MIEYTIQLTIVKVTVLIKLEGTVLCFLSLHGSRNVKKGQTEICGVVLRDPSEIEKGNISENQLLPSIREVSRQLGISSTTGECL